MKINEAMKITGLTKKAIYYYEEVGLIEPTKDNANNYRIYTEKDVDRLKQINVLRKLDISIKDINTILDKPLELNEIMYRQLDLFKSRIQYLNKSKEIIENLIEDNNNGNVDTITDNLEKLIVYLDMDDKMCSGYMSKELERIFPGGFGRLVSIMYSAFLDEPIDTDEKQKAWIGLVNDLDSAVEMKIPEDIKIIMEELFENINKKGLNDFKTKNEKFINNVITPINELTLKEKEDVDKKIEDSKNNEKYKDMADRSKKLAQFFKESPKLLPDDFAKNLKVLSSRFRMYSENIGEVMKSKYKMAKAWDNIL
jgi:DNA-binding transcriptional MerR regulator